MSIANPPPPLPDEDLPLNALTSASKVWIEFSVFFNGLVNYDDVADASLSGPHPRFHRFPDLPPEIRLKIWSYLICPRIVTACCFERDERLLARREAFERRSAGAFVPQTCGAGTVFNPTCPAILLVCRESRAFGLEHYQLAFGWEVSSLQSDTPIARPPRAWFNFRLDALYLVGELEVYDKYGFQSPMVNFLKREDAWRVRYVGCALEVLRYPEQGSDQIFGCLWHIVDRFWSAKRLLLAMTPEDEAGMRGWVIPSTDNIMDKIVNGWILGTTVISSSMADTQILMVKESDLADAMASHAEEDEGERTNR